MIGEASSWELVAKVAVRGNKLFEGNLHITNERRWEFEWFTAMSVAWRTLPVKVKNVGSNECHSSEHFLWEEQ